MTGRINDSIGDKIHRYIHKNGSVLVKSICIEFGISVSNAHNHISSLKVKGRVQPVGITHCPITGHMLDKRYESIETPPPVPAIKSVVGRKKIAPPESKYRTQWIGGSHPCEQYNPIARIAA